MAYHLKNWQYILDIMAIESIGTLVFEFALKEARFIPTEIELPGQEITIIKRMMKESYPIRTREGLETLLNVHREFFGFRGRETHTGFENFLQILDRMVAESRTNFAEGHKL